MEKQKNSISVVLPVYGLDNTTKETIKIALQSIANQKTLPQEVVIVVPTASKDLDYIKTLDFGEIKGLVTIIENTGKTDVASQINLGVLKSKSEWISLLEQDDEFSSIWFKSVTKYIEKHSSVDIFLPLIIDVDTTGSYIGLTNEAVWAQGFSDDLGYLDLNSLLVYQNFNTDGMVMRKSAYEEIGGLKPSIKLTFIYEFLLRACFKDIKTMAIPKFGYKHVVMRLGGLFDTYKKEMSTTEAKFWLQQSKKEYFFDKDRDTKYENVV